jgi:hypothetical protein
MGSWAGAPVEVFLYGFPTNLLTFLTYSSTISELKSLGISSATNCFAYSNQDDPAELRMLSACNMVDQRYALAHFRLEVQFLRAFCRI